MNKQYLKKGVYHASFELIENEFSLRATENYYLDVKFFLNGKNNTRIRIPNITTLLRLTH